jgi:hypothetical protein
MTWPSVIGAALCTSLLWVQESVAQSWPESGSRIRISADSGQTMTGRFIGLAGNSVQLVAEDELQSRLFPLSRTRRVEVSQGRSSAAMKGMVIGGLSGVALAALVVAAHPGGAGDFTAAQGFLLAAGWLGVIGMGSGVVVGAFFTIEDWRRMPLTLEPASVAARRRGGIRVQLTRGTLREPSGHIANDSFRWATIN